MRAKTRFLLIAQPDSYRIAPYINAARRMGLSVQVASRGEYSLVSEVYEGLHIDLNRRFQKAYGYKIYAVKPR